MLGMKDAVFLALSTPLGSDNWLSQAIKIKDENGVPYFPVIQVGLVCDQCMATGQTDIMEQCEHRRGISPPWKSETRGNRMRKIGSLLDDAGRALRENAGVVVDSGETSFDQKLLKQWFENPPLFTTEHIPNKIYVTIDPDAGGGKSQCAIVSGYRLAKQVDNYTQQTFVITGLESISTKNHAEQQALLILHIQKLRLNPRFKYVPIIAIPEVGTGFNHTVLDQGALSQYSCYTLHENNGPIPGVRKTSYLTQAYVLSFEDMLNELRFVLEKDWITVYGYNGKKGLPILNELHVQLGRFGKDEHGKLGGKMGGQFHDDLSVAFLMIIYWSRVLEQPTRNLNPYYEWLLQIFETENNYRNLSVDDITTLKNNLAVNSANYSVLPPNNFNKSNLDYFGLKQISGSKRTLTTMNGTEVTTNRGL